MKCCSRSTAVLLLLLNATHRGGTANYYLIHIYNEEECGYNNLLFAVHSSAHSPQFLSAYEMTHVLVSLVFLKYQVKTELALWIISDGVSNQFYDTLFLKSEEGRFHQG